MSDGYYYIGWYDPRYRGLKFTGTENKHLVYADHADFDPGTQDFGAGFIFYCDSTSPNSSNLKLICGKPTGASIGAAEDGWYVGYMLDDEYLIVYLNDGDSSPVYARTANGSILADNWNYIFVAIDRNVGASFYLNNAAVAASVDNLADRQGDISNSDDFLIGGGAGAADAWKGYISQVLWYKGWVPSSSWVEDWYYRRKYNLPLKPLYPGSVAIPFNGTLTGYGMENVTLDDVEHSGEISDSSNPIYSNYYPNVGGYWFHARPGLQSAFTQLDGLVRVPHGDAVLWKGGDGKERYRFEFITQGLAERYMIEGAYLSRARLGFFKDVNVFDMTVCYMPYGPIIREIYPSTWQIQAELVEL